MDLNDGVSSAIQALTVQIESGTVDPAQSTVPPSVVQRILLQTDGSVTEIVEAFADEPVQSVKLFEGVIAAEAAIPPLEIERLHAVLCRRILLQGKQSQRIFLYADSTIVLNRLPPGIQASLQFTSVPIGHLLRQHRVETFREILASGLERVGPLAAYFGTEAGAAMHWRTYRILAGCQPIMMITEKFPTTHFVTQ